MNYEVISSGSDGNCLIIDNTIAIDMGVPFKKIRNCYKNIKLVLLTHIHSLRSL